MLANYSEEDSETERQYGIAGKVNGERRIVDGHGIKSLKKRKFTTRLTKMD